VVEIEILYILLACPVLLIKAIKLLSDIADHATCTAAALFSCPISVLITFGLGV